MHLIFSPYSYMEGSPHCWHPSNQNIDFTLTHFIYIFWYLSRIELIICTKSLNNLSLKWPETKKSFWNVLHLSSLSPKVEIGDLRSNRAFYFLHKFVKSYISTLEHIYTTQMHCKKSVQIDTFTGINVFWPQSPYASVWNQQEIVTSGQKSMFKGVSLD
jgi:hypothetical protein